jgi:anti-sigma B factor antagonist
VIVDFEHLDYISSAGLGVFMVFIEDIRKQGGDILLAAMRDNVFSVFDLLGFQVLFRIFPTVDEAMAALSNNA